MGFFPLNLFYWELLRVYQQISSVSYSFWDKLNWKGQKKNLPISKILFSSNSIASFCCCKIIHLKESFLWIIHFFLPILKWIRDTSSDILHFWKVSRIFILHSILICLYVFLTWFWQGLQVVFHTDFIYQYQHLNWCKSKPLLTCYVCVMLHPAKSFIIGLNTVF